jgi:hypothetical protein
MIEKVASRLSGAAGPSSADAVDLQNWLLRYGKESSALREELAEWASWLANEHPPWAAYRALMACRLVALDKQPGMRPVGIGEIFHRLFAKAMLLVVGKEATRACDNLNLCASLKAGIEGAVHALRDAWEEDLNDPPPAPKDAPTQEEEPPGNSAAQAPLPDLLTQPMDPDESDDEEEDPHLVLLVDAPNGFNELGRKAALWTVRHKWVAGARFAFNCYRHSATLILRRPGRPDSYTLQSREGVTQGDPLATVIYGLAIAPPPIDGSPRTPPTGTSTVVCG